MSDKLCAGRPTLKFVIAKKKPTKNQPLLNFKIKLRSYKKEDIEKQKQVNPEHKANSVERVVPAYEWERYGFHAEMSIDEARERAKQLNTQQKLEDERRARFGRISRIKKESDIKSAFLPPQQIKDFEIYLMNNFRIRDKQEFLTSKQYYIWLTCKKIIKDIEIDPKDWEDNKVIFYNYFIEKGWSLSYCEKLIGILNRWGSFYSKKLKKYFSSLPYPVSYDKSDIVDSYNSKKKKTNESAPLTYAILQKNEDSFSEEQYNWLFLSLFFGLRPKEVDSFLDKRNWKITTQKGVKVLWMYQSKLRGIEEKERWKLIPCLLPEQTEALKIISKKYIAIKRPLVKTIKRYLGEDLNTYGGRKGFELMMRNKGFSLEAISSYLGHKSIDRTYRNYRAKTVAYIENKKVA